MSDSVITRFSEHQFKPAQLEIVVSVSP